jgi:molybdenum cofactor cytidylyltransferase
MATSPSPLIKGIVLAAGQSRRLGQPKQLLVLDGKSLISHVVECCLGSRLDDVLVVVGHEAAAVRHALTGLDVFFVVNDRHEEGQSTSLIAGIAAAGRAGAVVVVLADQPGIDGAAINRLIEARQAGATLGMARYGERRGHPVLFGHEVFDELRYITGDQGGRDVLRRHGDDVVLVDGGSDQVPVDVDTAEDYAQLLERAPTAQW